MIFKFMSDKSYAVENRTVTAAWFFPSNADHAFLYMWSSWPSMYTQPIFDENTLHCSAVQTLDGLVSKLFILPHSSCTAMAYAARTDEASFHQTLSITLDGESKLLPQTCTKNKDCIMVLPFVPNYIFITVCIWKFSIGVHHTKKLP